MTTNDDFNIERDGYFGVCPHCHRHDGYVNIDRSHFFVCDQHHVRWCVGFNLFSSCEEPEGQAAIVRIAAYADVEPYREGGSPR